MAELKTKKNKKDPKKFIEGVKDLKRKEDSLVLLKLFRSVTGDKGKMWGEFIIGFGDYHYKYKSGREGDWFKTGFSPRKQNISLYVMVRSKKYLDLLKKLGKHKKSVGCLYINKLEDVDLSVLKKIIKESFESEMKTC